ncbi:MAG: alpha/beta hydrolase [Chloroflexi bacterium]|nr:alpha/beta hydrolase [Chloroflexota bacterium]
MATPFPEAPSRIIPSRDGTGIAVFSAGRGPDVLLVHGTSADHRTWRVVAPDLAGRRRIHALDRRGRGDSSDGSVYVIDRELEDVAAVADILADEEGGPIDLVGHSLGGRIALAASRLTGSIRRVVAYESAPGTRDASGQSDDEELLRRLRADLAAGDLDGLLARFMTDAVGMPAAELSAFRADPIWARRAAAGPTIVRELDAALHAPAIAADALALVTVPVLQLTGSLSAAWFRDGALALDARLAKGRLEVIEGARHAAHHTHPAEFLARVQVFFAD